MFQQMKKRIKNERGLTLIELLAVIVILGIVAAIAVPAIGGIIDNSRYNAVKADAINVLNAANLYYTETSSADEDITVELLIKNEFLDSAGKIPDNAVISKGSPRGLTAEVKDAVGSKAVQFNNATIDDINEDDQKGSAETIKAIGTAPTN